jgi:asparagine synthase (glutamine-hydrolysing)
MCGIAGIWRLEGHLTKNDERDLKSMTKALAHRGPDGEGYWTSGSIGLGHRRLAILDRSEIARQPMQTPDGQGILSYNGEVYNYVQLRRELEETGLAFRSSGDTEVILQALHHWGPEKAIARFNGMFALAYFDQRTSTLWLARDRLGIKPLYILRHGKRLLFASEDKAFLGLSCFTASVDARALTLRFIRMNEANSTSMLNGVDRLAPGTILKLQNGIQEEIRYWDILSNFDPKRINGDQASDAEKRHQLESLLAGSVHLHLAADTPVATCLSGGVDSGLITAIAVRENAGINAFVADPYSGPNESAAATRTAAMCGAKLVRVSTSAEQLLRLWPKSIFALESCGYSQSHNALLAITEKCRAKRFPVMLTGEGSDELLGGYYRYRSTGRLWRPLDPPISWFLRRKSRERLIRQLSSAPFSDSCDLAKSRMPMEFLKAAAPGQSMNQMKCAQATQSVSGASNRGIIAAGLYDLVSHLQELLHRHDRLGMAASIETRVPFVENGLIDFGMHLQARHRVIRSTTKPLLKKIAEKYIPRENIYKQKQGFPVTGAYSAGSEALVENGYLKDVMRWSSTESHDVVELAKADEYQRLQLVGAELFARIFIGNQTFDELGDKLVTATASFRTSSPQ